MYGQNFGETLAIYVLMEKRIKGLVIDEAHAAVDNWSFRSSFQSLGPQLATLPAPVGF